MNTFNSVVLRLLTLSCAGLLLSACGSLSQVDDQGHSSEPRFPAVSESYRPQGSYANLENLAKIQPGMSKAQLYELIGAPHFHEGMFAVREWDYILRFRRAGQADLVCQYKVLFDKEAGGQSCCPACSVGAAGNAVRRCQLRLRPGGPERCRSRQPGSPGCADSPCTAATHRGYRALRPPWLARPQSRPLATPRRSGPRLPGRAGCTGGADAGAWGRCRRAAGELPGCTAGAVDPVPGE